MYWIRRLYRKLAVLIRGEKFKRELEEEMAFHREETVKEFRADGMALEDARHAANRQFGNDTRLRDESHETAVFWFEGMLQDFRFALRQLRRNPGFAFTVTLILALGIGASVAIFAFVDAALIKPLPYRDAGRLVSVFEKTPACPQCNVSYLNFRDWKRSDLPFSSLDAWGYSTYLLRTPAGAEPAPGARVTDGFFRTLGVTPMLGRDFYTGEDAPGKPHSVVISYGAWQKRFAGSPDVIGKTVTLSDISYTVIGVLPRNFHFAPRDAEFWAALNDPASCELRRGCHSLFGIARLKDGVSIATALTAMKSVALRMEKQYSEDRGFSADVLGLSEWIIGKIRPVLLVLLGGAGLLLLIACVNISSLLLVRSESRRREIAVRSALGASPARLLRQFVIEGLVLVVSGSICGLASAYAAMQLLVKLIPAGMLEYMPYLQGLGLNVRVLAFAGLVTLFAAALFSITPALRLSSADVQGDLAEGSRSSSGLLWRRIGSKLVVLELVIAVVLLACAGLLGKSLYQLLHVSIGFEPDHIATLQITMPQAYAEDKQVLALERRMVQRLQSLPGVRSVGISTSLPARGWDLSANIVVTGRPWNGEHNAVPQRNVSADYLKVLGAKLIRGRFFTDEEDDPAKPGVVLINQAFASKFFPGEQPVGKRISFEGSHDSMEIIGLLENIKEGQLDTVDQAAFYQPFSQGWFRTFYLAVRTSQAERPMLPTLIAAIHRIDPSIATSYPMTMTDQINDSSSTYLHRSAAWIVGGFATIALLLGIVGLYGVIAYSVGQRTREIGVRIALGAQRGSVYRLIVGEAGWLIASGLVIGLGLSIAVAALMRSLLFGVRVWDVPTLGAVALLLAGSALLASFLPARRAASVNPVEALRAE